MDVHALLAVGINRDGHRELLGVDISSGEDKAGWLTSLSRARRPRIERGETCDLRCPRWPLGGDRSNRYLVRRGNAAERTTR